MGPAILEVPALLHRLTETSCASWRGSVGPVWGQLLPNSTHHLPAAPSEPHFAQWKWHHLPCREVVKRTRDVPRTPLPEPELNRQAWRCDDDISRALCADAF